MITIKKGNLKIETDNDSFMSFQDTSNGLYFKFKDGTELIFEIPVTAQVRAIPNMLMKATAKNIIIDLNAKNMISFQG